MYDSLCVGSKKKNKQKTPKKQQKKQKIKQIKSRNISINIENKLMVTRGEGCEVWAKWMKGSGKYRLLIME